MKEIHNLRRHNCVSVFVNLVVVAMSTVLQLSTLLLTLGSSWRLQYSPTHSPIGEMYHVDGYF